MTLDTGLFENERVVSNVSKSRRSWYFKAVLQGYEICLPNYCVHQKQQYRATAYLDTLRKNAHIIEQAYQQCCTRGPS